MNSYRNVFTKYMSKILTYGIMAFVVIVSLGPLIWVFMSSFKTNNQILNNPFTLPTSISFSAYGTVLGQYNFFMYTINSFFIAITATVIGTAIYTLSAYIFAKYNFKFKNALFILFTLTLLVPSQAKTQPLFSLVQKMHIYDTRASLIIIYTSFGMAMSLFILRAAFTSIPVDLSEAAEIDGAGFGKIFLKINLPLAKSGIATAAVLAFLNYWNEYYYASMFISSDSKRTLPFALASLNTSLSYDYTLLFAAVILCVLPGIIVYVLAQEQVQASVASTGIKG